MITTVIVIFLWIIVLPVAASEGAWGSFWLAVVLGVLALWLGAAGREVDRAYTNCIDYWARKKR